MNTSYRQKGLNFTVSLSREAHQLAHRFRQGQFDAKRAKQVYLNTLSLYGVNFYLRCMGYETFWEGSDSFDSVMRLFADVADLEVKPMGKFECRPVLPDDRTVRIPPEVWQHRRGYFAVQLNSSLTEAKLLGFLKRATAEEVPLNELNSLDTFLQYTHQLERSVKLDRWLNHVFEAGWEQVDAVLSPLQMSWRGSGDRPLGYSYSSPLMPERVKRLNLERGDQEVALLVRLMPQTDREMGIGVEVYPTGDRIYLPQDLKLMVLDEMGAAVMQAEARSTKNIQLKFRGMSGEEFSVKVALGEVSVTEAFLI